MTAPSVYFAYCTAADTTFGPSFYRMDEDIVALRRVLGEGDFPKLELTIKNPRRGLLNDPTKLWAWVALASGPTPLFFGKIQGLPNNLDQETIKISLIARDDSWLILQQAAAEQLKSLDGYDPVFINVENRDDPSSIMEGFDLAFHYAHLPSGSPARLQVSTSNIIEPEDGFSVFPDDIALFDNVDFKIGGQPLTTCGAILSVHWTQIAAGTVDMGSFVFGGSGGVTAKVATSGYVTKSPGGQVAVTQLSGSYTAAINVVRGSVSTANTVEADGTCWTGSSLISSWPKSGVKLSGGYTVASAFALGDGAQFGSPQSHSLKFENKEKTHIVGDTMSIDKSWTSYPCGGRLFLYDISAQNGLVDPWGSLTLDGPEGVNIPVHVTYSETLVCSWTVRASLALDYEAARPHTETLQFRINADVQPVLSDPDLPASVDQEIDKLPGADVGAPLWNTLSWYTLQLRGAVQQGQTVKSTQEFPGDPVYAIALNSGAVGASEPNWPDTLGTTITDGTVVWAILGFNPPSADIPPWQNVETSVIALGTVIRAQTFLSAPVDWAGVAIAAPAAGTQSFQMCIQAGETQQYTNSTFTGVADVSPNYPQPAFSPAPGATTSDGTVIWVSLGDGSVGGIMEVPLGLNPGQNCYFSTDRGQKSLRYGISRQRSKMRLRSRAATTRFDAPFDNVVNITCRMGVQLFDGRLPGGSALGKVTQTELVIDLNAQEYYGTITFKSCLGKDGSPILTGEGDYGDLDYDEGEYQQTSGLVDALVSNDVAYAVPVGGPDADDVSFPITDKSQIVVKEAVIIGKPPGAPNFIANSFITVTDKMTYLNSTSQAESTVTRHVAVPVGHTPIFIPKNFLDQGGVATATQDVWFFPIYQYYLELKSLEASFSKNYNVRTSQLFLPKQIDTAAGSLP